MFYSTLCFLQGNEPICQLPHYTEVELRHKEAVDWLKDASRTRKQGGRRRSVLLHVTESADAVDAVMRSIFQASHLSWESSCPARRGMLEQSKSLISFWSNTATNEESWRFLNVTLYLHHIRKPVTCFDRLRVFAFLWSKKKSAAFPIVQRTP